METKRLFWTSLIVLPAALAASSVFAVTASPQLKTLQQPDGSRFQARQWGDERMHGWETADGYSIVYDQARSAWTYAVRDAGGRLVSSSTLVTKGAPAAAKRLRPSAAVIAKVPDKTTSRQQKFLKAMAAGTPPSRAIPTLGTGHQLTILVNFSDTTSTNTQAQFNTLIYGGAGTKSVNDHYTEMSHGAYTLTGAVIDWYKAPKTHDYYGANTGVGGGDAHPGELVAAAVAALEVANPAFDWAPYDQDGDCYVDSVSVVHQGTGEEEGASATDIWSHSWNLYSANYYGDGPGRYTTHTACPAGGSIIVDDYVIQPERSSTGMITAGVYSHEYGHALGLPDLYDTDGSSEGVGDWSLMAGGSWNYVSTPGDTPAHMDPWSKYALGWLTPTNVSGTVNASIQAASAANAVYKLGPGNAASGEYYLVENRQLSGFDAGLPGGGLLIWHVDASINPGDNSDNNNECAPGTGWDCTATNHYKVALVQADNRYDLEYGTGWGGNRGDATDPYYLGNNSAFNATSAPGSNWYDGSASTVSVVNIGSSASTMTATLAYSGSGGNAAPVAVADSYATAADTALNVTAATGVLANDTDADGDTLTASLVTNPSHGTVALNADGSFLYTPEAGYNGNDSFTYVANDGTDNSSAATVTITVGSGGGGGGGGGGGAFSPLALLIGLPFVLRRRRRA